MLFETSAFDPKRTLFKTNKNNEETEMNWDAIGAIAEVAGVIGIIVSIGYLGMQVRHSNQVAEDASFKSTFGLGITVYLEMIESENVDVIMNGLLSYDELRGP